MENIKTSIIECSRCQDPQVFKTAPGYMDSDIPVALELSLDGGYMMFVDNIYYVGDKNPLEFMLCHKCAHEFTQFMGIPEKTVTNWHPKTDDPYCNGWTMLNNMEIELEALKQKLYDLVYMNEHTMMVPFDDYADKKAKLEEIIKLQEERIKEYVSRS